PAAATSARPRRWASSTWRVASHDPRACHPIQNIHFPHVVRAGRIRPMPPPIPPPVFEPLFRTSPFLDHLGPFFMRKQADGTFVVGVRVQPHHANGRGVAHGGLLMTLCDIALGYCTTSNGEPRPLLTTASIY